jgi:hypothetical protein
VTNLVVFNIYWYLFVSMLVTIWALSDALTKKQGRLGKIWDWFIALIGVAAWYTSIQTFQKYMLGTLPQEILKDMDSWINVYLTLGYLFVSYLIYFRAKKECEKCG